MKISKHICYNLFKKKLKKNFNLYILERENQRDYIINIEEK